MTIREWSISKRRASLAASLLAIGALAAGTANAAYATPPLAAAVRAGTTGLGFDVALRTSDRTHLRLAASRFGHDTTISTTDFDYDADVDLAAALLLLDWYPRGGAFRLSIGGGWNGTEADVSTPLSDLIRPHFPSLPAIFIDFGSAVGTVRGNDLVPAVLLGWGNPFRGGPWYVSFEVGAFYQGEPEADLSYLPGEFPVDTIPGGQQFLDTLAAEAERDLEEELRDYTVVPVMSLSVGYRF